MEINKDNPELSIVIPCYNCEKTIEELHQRLNKALSCLNVTFEIIYVNDNSKDMTSSLLQSLALNDKNVTAIDLMFNVGQFRALVCGLDFASGNYVITMDDDLQHPPEQIAQLYYAHKANAGVDAVIGRYKKKQHSFIRNLGSLLMQKLCQNESKIQLSSFRCLNRKAVAVLLAHKTMFPLIGTLLLKSTSRIINVDVEHDERKRGRSNYTLFKLIQTVLDKIFSTSLPLKFVSYSGILISMASLVIALYYFIQYLTGKIHLPGWTTVVLLINIYSGLLLLSIGTIGEYIFRILIEVSGGPRYYVKNVHRSRG